MAELIHLPAWLPGFSAVAAAAEQGIEASSHMAPKIGGTLLPVTVRWIRNRCGDIRTVPLVDGLQAVMAYDWGRPAYCREQLLALGFAEEDLEL